MSARSSEQNMVALCSWQMSQVAASLSFCKLTLSCFLTTLFALWTLHIACSTPLQE